MGCGSNQYGGSVQSTDCIRDVIRKIIDAQRKVAGSQSASCDTSCERSIESLLSPSHEQRPHRHTTIPIMLINKSGKTFVGSGLVGKSRGSDHEHFKCVESPVFRVRGFAGNSPNCVHLEILLPVHKQHDGGGIDSGDHSHHGKGCGCASSCDHFGKSKIKNFRDTGLCITVDLDCFCGITCLDPITPIPV